MERSGLVSPFLDQGSLFGPGLEPESDVLPPAAGVSSPAAGEPVAVAVPAEEPGEVPVAGAGGPVRAVGGWFVPPSGEKSRAAANLAAVRLVVGARGREGAALGEDERRVLARWSGWGALPDLFEGRPRRLGAEAEELAGLLSAEELRAAAGSTINAHYTSPVVAEAVWGAVVGLGWRGGRVLEPGCGNGVFFGALPPGAEAELVGVELDGLTAELAGLLHPGARVVAGDFKDFHEGGFGLAVGNVPFASFKPYDPVDSPQADLSLHNYMLYKSLRLLEPGGLLAAVTSSFTLDAQNPSQRERLASLGRFLGAVRLPNNAFRAHAGTDVVADVVLFQRRDGELPLERAAEEEWTRPGAADVLDERVRGSGRVRSVAVGSWFADNPHLVLGETVIARGGGMYADGQPTVRAVPGADLGAGLREALGEVTERALSEGVAEVPAGTRLVRGADGPAGGWVPPEWALEGSLHAAGGGFFRVERRRGVPFDPPRGGAGELRAVLEVRDAAGALLRAEAGLERGDVDVLRAELNRVYDRYVSRFGHLNRPGRGVKLGGFASDPGVHSVRALETRSATGEVVKADIFVKRTLFAPPAGPADGAVTARDALNASMSRFGRVDPEFMREATGGRLDDSELLAGCFLNPETDRWEPEELYLSGHIPSKLAAAEAAAGGDGRFARNVDRLREVLPAPVAAEDIGVRLGVGWVTVEEVAEFIADTLDIEVSEFQVSYTEAGFGWKVRSAGAYRHGETFTSEWGTPKRDAFKIVEAGLRNSVVKVMRKVGEGDEAREELDEEATAAAIEKVEAWQTRFREWLFFDDPARAEEVAARYNDAVGGWVPPSFSGEWVNTPPGLKAQGIDLHDHQKAAVAQILTTGDLLLAHKVGAGKTWTMATAAMEMKRMGIASKPMFVLPNHLVGQFQSDFLTAFPNARLLTPMHGEVGSGKKADPRGFGAKCAYGDWDAVLMRESDFENLAVHRRVFHQRLRDEVKMLAAAYDEAKASGALHVKQIQQALKSREAKLEKEMADHAAKHRSGSVTFEELGVDYLFVDEAHLFKNLPIISTNADLMVGGSTKSVELEERLKWLRKTYPGKGVCTLSTATPVANKLAEAYVMQRYVQPSRLQEAGIRSFDHWTASFGKVVTRPEAEPSGDGWRMRSSFAAYQNIPELMRLMRVSSDFKMGDDIKLDTPALVMEEESPYRTVTVIPKNEPLDEYVEELIARRKNLGNVDPREDNMLKLVGDARKAALDLRLVGREQQDEWSKINAAAENIHRVWEDYRNMEFSAVDSSGLDTGEPSPIRGACQLVFCDLGTPGGSAEFAVYYELKARLEEKGIPAEGIRFIHDAGEDKTKKERLFKECRAGKVSVLIGSTEKCGTGMNIQHRLAALHHLDVPWRPADLEQREGRILRQGNQHKQVHVFKYLAEGSFDVYSWQTVERKALFIESLMSGRHGGGPRSYEEDEDHASMTAAKMKAIAANNQTMIAHLEATDRLNKLERRKETHMKDQTRLENIRLSSAAQKARLEYLIDQSERMTPEPGGGHADWKHHDWEFAFAPEWKRILSEKTDQVIEKNEQYLARHSGDSRFADIRPRYESVISYHKMIAGILAGDETIRRFGSYTNARGKNISGEDILSNLLYEVVDDVETKHASVDGWGKVPFYHQVRRDVGAGQPLTYGTEVGSWGGVPLWVWPYRGGPEDVTGQTTCAYVGFGAGGVRYQSWPKYKKQPTAALTRMLTNLPKALDDRRTRLSKVEQDIRSVKRRSGRDFPDEEELTRARTKERMLAAQLAAEQGLDKQGLDSGEPAAPEAGNPAREQTAAADADAPSGGGHTPSPSVPDAEQSRDYEILRKVVNSRLGSTGPIDWEDKKTLDAMAAQLVSETGWNPESRAVQRAVQKMVDLQAGHMTAVDGNQPGRLLEDNEHYRAGWTVELIEQVRNGRGDISALPRVNELLEHSESAGWPAEDVHQLFELWNSLMDIKAGVEPVTPEDGNRPGREPASPAAGESTPSASVPAEGAADDPALVAFQAGWRATKDSRPPPGRRLDNDPDYRAGWIAGHASRVRQGRYKASALPRVNELLERSESAGLSREEVYSLVDLRDSLSAMKSALEPETPVSREPAVQEAEPPVDGAERRRESRDKGRVNVRVIRSRPPAGREDSGGEKASPASPDQDEAVDAEEERRREVEGALKDMLPSGLESKIRVVHTGPPPSGPVSDEKRRPSRGDIGW